MSRALADVRSFASSDASYVRFADGRWRVRVLLSLSIGALAMACNSDWTQKRTVVPAFMVKDYTSLDGPLMCVAVSADGRLLASANMQGAIAVYDVKSGKELRRFRGPDAGVLSAVLALDFCHDTLLLAGGGDGVVRIWDWRAGKELGAYAGHSGSVRSVKCLSDNKRALVGSADDNTVWLWDLAKRKKIRKFQGKDRPDSVAVEGNERCFFTTEFKAIRCWDLESGRSIGVLEGHEARVYSLALTPKGDCLLSGGGDGVALWDLNKKKVLRRFSTSTEGSESVAISADGKLALAGGINEMFVWDVANGRTLKEFRELDGEVRVAWIAKQPYAVSCEFWGKLRLWSMEQQAR